MHARPVAVRRFLPSAVPSAVPSALLVLATLVAAASACGGAKVEASTNGTGTTAPPATYTPPAPTGPAPTGPAPTAAPTATSTGPATPILPVAAAVVQPILTQMGQGEAPGAQPDGSPFAGQFQTGQTLEQVINIKGNGCYTIVGASVGIQQLDITLLILPPGLAPFTVAQSTPAGANATLGGKAAGCWRNPTPFAGQAKVVMRATAGAGLAAAQVFVK